MGFGKAVRRLRTERGWKQEELARRSGIRQGYISDIELGKKENPTQDTLVKLAAAFEISVAELLQEAGAVGVRVRPPLPYTEGFPAILTDTIQRLGRMLSEDDYRLIAAYAEGLAARRAGGQMATGYTVADEVEDDQQSADKRTA